MKMYMYASTCFEEYRKIGLAGTDSPYANKLLLTLPPDLLPYVLVLVQVPVGQNAGPTQDSKYHLAHCIR